MSEAAAAAAPSAPSTSAPSDSSPSVDKAPVSPSGDVSAKPDAQDKITVKVHGKLRTMSRDEAIRELQKGFASRENFEKAASLTQKNQTLLRALQDPDPGRQDEALKQLGVDPDKIAERRLQIRAKQAQMTPEQQRIAELESQLAEGERTKAEAAERQQQEAVERQDREIWAKTEQEYIAEIDKAVQSGQLAGVTPSEALYLMAEAAEMNLAYGLDLPASELIAEARSNVDSARADLQQKVLGGLSDDALLEFLGPDVVKKVATAAVKKFKAGAPIQQLQSPAPIADQNQREEKPKWIRPSEVKAPWF